MKFTLSKQKPIVIVMIAVFAFLAFAGIICGLVFGIIAATNEYANYKMGDKSINFNSQIIMTNEYAITAPASGVTRRKITATIWEKDEKTNQKIYYSMDKEVPGVYIDGDTLVVSADLKKNDTFYVTASATENIDKKNLYVSRRVQVIKDNSLKDVAPNPIEKEGWDLYFNDEFDGDTLDYSSWSPYYLRNWSNSDERAKSNSFLENGSLVLRCDENTERYSSQDGSTVTGIMSYETNYLHKFGEPGYGAIFNRDIPEFDGVATKYGYYEVRLKMPDTRDGSHFAWWMIGTQDDMNETAYTEGGNAPLDGHYSNQTGEIDIIENYTTNLNDMKNWRPVIHPNGTTDYEYHWLDLYEIPGDPSLEYHVYGFEWDENGTKFYVDGNLASTSDRSPNYRMMTIFSLYSNAGYGADMGIYPKDVYIDYFRIYKKSEPLKAYSVAYDKDTLPSAIKIPANGETTVSLTANALDQFDNVIDADIKWRFSSTIDGFTPTSAPEHKIDGVSIDPVTGEITVSDSAQTGKDLFVTAYVNDMVKQTYHIKLSKDPSRDYKLVFENKENVFESVDGVISVKRDEDIVINAVLYDQYLNRRYDEATQHEQVVYNIAADIAGAPTVIEGVTLEGNTLRISSSVPKNTVIIITARSGNKLQNLILKL